MWCQSCGSAIEMKGKRSDGTLTCTQCGSTVALFGEPTIAPGVAPSLGSDEGVVGLSIPGYKILREVGRGGMGFVFEARQESLNRSVAIKVLAPKLGADPQFAARFEAEAAALARLAHPNIVSIYERGRCGDRLYFVMEYVAGDGQGGPVDLKNIISKGPMGDEEARRLIVQVMRALSVAHAEGIVHRDIKPGNILLDRHGNAKVADFGIACFSESSGRDRFTQPAAAMGTYDYMAPEQRADASTSDGRADVYSTATMLYEMLTGRIPAGAFQPPSIARTGVHPSWDVVIARGMQPVRDDRYATMDAFLSAVEQSSFGVAVLHPQATQAASAPVTSLSLPCHECGQSVRDDAQFCPSCRSPQFVQCLKCGARMRAALNGCEECGSDLLLQRTYHKFLSLGTVALERARTSGTSTDRIQAAQEAGLALVRARKTGVDEGGIGRLLAEANRLVESLATKAAREAAEANRLGEAIVLLDAVLDVAPGREDAQRLRAKLAGKRDRGVEEATKLRDDGRPVEAGRLLADLARRYADDQLIADLLHDCEKRAIGLKAVVRDTVPALVAGKQWRALQTIVQQLRDEGAQVAGLDDLESRVVAINKSVEPLIADAEKALTARNYANALQRAEAVLEKVADHPRAIELRDAASGALHGLRDVVVRLKNNVEQGRFLVARHVAQGLTDIEKESPTVARLLKRADVGVEQANRFASLVVSATVMALAVIVWSFVAGGVREGLLKSWVAIEAGSSLFGSRWPVSFFLLCTNIWVGIGAAAAASILCARPIGRRTIIAAAAIAAVCGFVAMFLIAPHRWELPLDDLLRRLNPSRWASLSALKAHVGAFTLWGGYGIAISMCLAGMAGTPRVPLWSLALPAWVAAAVVALGTPPNPATVRSYVGPALLMAAITRLFGRSDRNAYLVVMLVIGLLAGWFTGLLEHRVNWLTPILAFALLSPAQLAFTRPRSVMGWIGDLLFASLAVVLAKYLQVPLLRIDQTVAVTPGAILVAAAVAASMVAEQLSRRKEMVRHLRLPDRYASRSWSILPLSDPT